MARGESARGLECLIWPFSTTSKGYPVARLANPRHMVLVCREICRRVCGEPPSPEHEAAHSCGRTSCINGTHLRWATGVENAADKIAHGTSLDGEKNHRAVLAFSEVQYIRNSRLSGAALGRQLGCSPSTIYAIRKGVTWRRM